MRLRKQQNTTVDEVRNVVLAALVTALQDSINDSKDKDKGKSAASRA